MIYNVQGFFLRFFDFWIALIALVCISPILLVVTIWLHFANKGAGAFSSKIDQVRMEIYSKLSSSKL